MWNTGRPELLTLPSVDSATLAIGLAFAPFVRWSFRASVPTLLEGLSEALLRLVSYRALFRNLGGRADLLPAGQPANRPSPQTETHRFRYWPSQTQPTRRAAMKSATTNFCWSRTEPLSRRDASARRLVRRSWPPRPAVKTRQPFPPAFTTSPAKRVPPIMTEDQEEAVTFPRPQNTCTIQIEHFLPAGRSTRDISRSRTTSCRARRSVRNRLR
ncbi:hypothetical protein V1286_001200 [Bradyrhizobium algeriense]|uniref:Uncharacterized protein n=1 Tax=Bradyrhizobium algeriense TaxID=634784 RepID=A0ABU8B6C2_9BRAD